MCRLFGSTNIPRPRSSDLGTEWRTRNMVRMTLALLTWVTHGVAAAIGFVAAAVFAASRRSHFGTDGERLAAGAPRRQLSWPNATFPSATRDSHAVARTDSRPFDYGPTNHTPTAPHQEARI